MCTSKRVVNGIKLNDASSSAFGAVLQGSLFGLVGLLPQKYSAIFMSGQGLAGTFAAIAMLIAIGSKPRTYTQNTTGWLIPSCLVTENIQNGC